LTVVVVVVVINDFGLVVFFIENSAFVFGAVFLFIIVSKGIGINIICVGECIENIIIIIFIVFSDVKENVTSISIVGVSASGFLLVDYDIFI
jgi:hypothetical protein